MPFSAALPHCMLPHAGNSSSPPTLREPIGPWIGPLFAVAVMIAAFYLLRQELKHHSWREIRQKVAEVPTSKIALAIGLTALNYLWLSGYDARALDDLGPRPRPTQALPGTFDRRAMA